MRTTIDLTEDASPAGGATMPDPCSVVEVDDDIVISLRETELRMTFMQFCDYREALNRYLFRSLYASAELEAVAIPDEDYYPAEEHETLRKLVTDLLGEAFDDVEVPDALRDRVRRRLAKHTRHARWRTQEQRIDDLAARVRELEGQLDMARAGSRPARGRKGDRS